MRQSPQITGGSVARHAARALLLFVVCGFALPLAHAASVLENFSTDPASRGWRTFGDASLFHWNAVNQNLEVTWDSARTNSYYWLPLGNVLSRNDDFNFAFDIRLGDIAAGTSSGKSYTFEIAVALFGRTNAFATNFFRGAGQSAGGPKNLVEFDYFPDSGYGDTFAGTVVTTNNSINFNSYNHPVSLTPGDLFHIALAFTSSNRVLRMTATKNGAPYGLPPSNTLYETVLTSSQDFRVDALGIMSYSDAVQIGTPTFWGSVRAHGTIDNVSLTMPEPPVRNFSGTRTNGVFRTQFLTRTNFTYVLERSTNAVDWDIASATNAGTGAVITVDDAAAPGAAYYRVRTTRP